MAPRIKQAVALGVVCACGVPSSQVSAAVSTPGAFAWTQHTSIKHSHNMRARNNRRPPWPIIMMAGDGAWSYGTSSDFLWGGSLSKTPNRVKPPSKDAFASDNDDGKLAKKRKKKSTATKSKRFSVGGSGAAIDRPYSSVIEVLRTYHSIHGDLVIPRRFVVPKSDDYPPKWHGVDLASTVYDMRWWQTHVKSNPDRVEELNELGFVWGRLQPEWNLVLEALMTYFELNDGNIMVPASFVVPYGDDIWPKATWGIPLGNCVHRIRVRGDFLNGQNAMSRRMQLEGLGFVWDASERAFLKVFRALKHFRKLEKEKARGTAREYRILRIPSTFVVPSGEDSGWPEDLWGLQLGAKCSAIRHKKLYVKNHPERKKALEELGFQWSGNATLGWLEVIHAAAIYSRINGRNLEVPTKFVVPAPPYANTNNGVKSSPPLYPDDEEWPWPEHLWGLSLGQRLKDIRLKGAYLKGDSASSRRAQLDALGFNWTPKRGRKKKAVA